MSVLGNSANSAGKLPVFGDGATGACRQALSTAALCFGHVRILKNTQRKLDA